MMRRALYSIFVRLHPSEFRRRFGGEMLSIFDHTPPSERFALVADAAVSLVRQRLLRREREPGSRAAESVAGVPMFLVLDNDPRLTRAKWTCGPALSFVAFATISALIGHGGRPAWVIGFGETSQPAARFISGYFQSLRVLSTLDLDHDLVLSAGEIANAPQRLLSLDADADGTLDGEECGQALSGDFMGAHPVLAALDANHDGVLSAAEIRNAAASLRQLDKNGDGRLTFEELLPEPLLKRVRASLRAEKK